MGAATSTQSRLLPQPQDIGEFRKLTGPVDQIVIPEVPEKRKVTDLKFTIIFAVSIVVLLPFLIYTLVHSDISRFTHGYDKCGNVCGQNNSVVDGISCTGRDMTDKPLLKYRENERYYGREDVFIPDSCEDSCSSSEYVIVYHRCFPKAGDNSEKTDLNAILTDIVDDIYKSTGYIVALCFIGFGLCIGMLLLFRYFVAVVVWVILIGSLLGIIALTIFFWYLQSVSSAETSNLFFGFAVAFSIISVILIIVMVFLYRKIKLVIRLFKEAVTVIFGIPIILFEPLLTMSASTILFGVFINIIQLISTAGFLEKTEYDLYAYVPNGVMMFTLWFHVVICFWMSQFIIGCQHMAISGAVSTYYFAKDKSDLYFGPLYNSLYNIVRYHLGTVAFGSLVITVIHIIKALIRSLVSSRQARVLLDCCLGSIEDFLKYLSKNAYIQTAMHGQPFYKSGKRAVRLLAANALSTIAVNSIGDFVLNMSKLLIIVMTIGIGILMNDSNIQHFWAAILISVIVTAIIAECFFAVFETAIDTIFLCFCEDSSINNGMERPYYMTTNLMQYIEEAKKNNKS